MKSHPFDALPLGTTYWVVGPIPIATGIFKQSKKEHQTAHYWQETPPVYKIFLNYWDAFAYVEGRKKNEGTTT